MGVAKQGKVVCCRSGVLQQDRGGSTTPIYIFNLKTWLDEANRGPARYGMDGSGKVRRGKVRLGKTRHDEVRQGRGVTPAYFSQIIIVKTRVVGTPRTNEHDKEVRRWFGQNASWN